MVSCIHGNGPWRFIVYWYLLDSEELLAYQGGFCYVELVNLLVTPVNILFITWKLICFSLYFTTLNSNVLFELLYHPHLCLTEFLKCNFNEFSFFCRVTNMLQMWLTHFLNIVLEWKLNLTKTVGMWAQSQRARLCKSDMYWQVRTENIVTSKHSGLNENRLFQDRKM